MAKSNSARRAKLFARELTRKGFIRFGRAPGALAAPSGDGGWPKPRNFAGATWLDARLPAFAWVWDVRLSGAGFYVHVTLGHLVSALVAVLILAAGGGRAAAARAVTLP